MSIITAHFETKPTAEIRKMVKTLRELDSSTDETNRQRLSVLGELLQIIADRKAKAISKPVAACRKARLIGLTIADTDVACLLTKLRVSHDDDICDGTTTHYKLIVEGGTRKFDRRDVADALREEFNTSPCGHDHDCCGCWHGGVYAVTKRRGAILFKTMYSRNY